MTVPEPQSATGEEGYTLVLGAGGFRGRAAIGVLAALEEAGRLPDAILGVSAGALIGVSWAMLGWNAERMAREVGALTSAQLLAFAGVLALPRLSPYLVPRCAGIPAWADTIARLGWDSPLQNGVRLYGVTTFDLISRKTLVFATGADNGGITVGEAVRASAAVPPVFRPVRIERGQRRYALVDGGVVDTLPLACAMAPPFSARNILAVDFSRDPRVRLRTARAKKEIEQRGGRLRVLHPEGRLGGVILASARAGRALIDAGRRTVTPDLLSALADRR